MEQGSARQASTKPRVAGRHWSQAEYCDWSSVTRGSVLLPVIIKTNS